MFDLLAVCRATFHIYCGFYLFLTRGISYNLRSITRRLAAGACSKKGTKLCRLASVSLQAVTFRLRRLVSLVATRGRSSSNPSSRRSVPVRFKTLSLGSPWRVTIAYSSPTVPCEVSMLRDTLRCSNLSICEIGSSKKSIISASSILFSLIHSSLSVAVT